MRKTSLNCVHELALKDSRVIFIGSDLGVGVLEKMKQEIPDRFIMEGVSEQHIIGMAAGMAMDGFIPYVNTIATFLTRRCFEQIAIDDIQTASDSLMEVYTSSNQNDGYVSLEVSPLLAKDTSKTIEEARRLWHSVNRPNLMIKIPATEEGFPAIEKLLSESININVTLIFSLEQYEKTAHSYLRGISNLTQMKNISSVASFFVSRIDTKVDKVLENINSPQSNELKGKAAIANANQAYQLFNSIFECYFSYTETLASMSHRDFANLIFSDFFSVF